MAVVSFSIPKYRHHKGSGQAFVQIKGKRHYLGSYGSPKSHEAYKRKIAELAASPAAATAAINAKAESAYTVLELAAAYWEFCQGNYRKKDGTPSGWLDHIHLTLNGPLAELYGTTPANQFGPKAFKAVRQKLIDAGHSRGYINKLMPIVTQCFQWGAAEELVSANVWHALRTVKGLKKGRTTARETPPVLPVNDVVVDATLPALPKVIADMVRFQRLTGCRPGEVCLLRLIDLDRNRFVKCPSGETNSSEVWEYRPASHKTEHHGKERIIFIGPKAQAIIKPYLDREATAYCFSPVESEAKRHEQQRQNRQTKLFPSHMKRPRKTSPRRSPATHYATTSYGRAIRRAVARINQQITETAEAAGVEPVLMPEWHLNQLRHTSATEVRRQFGLEASQVVLGHSKADVTQVYAERDQALAADVMRQIG